MTIIDLATRKPLDDRIAPVDIEIDLENTRIELARRIDRREVQSYEFEIGDDMHPYDRAVKGRRCSVCDGLFARRGRARAIRGPFDDQWRPIHEVCWLGALYWVPQ